MTTVAEAVSAMKTILLSKNISGQPRVDVFVGDAKAAIDSDQGAHPYIVLFPGAGINNRLEESLPGVPGNRLWTCQATCAGGDVDRALRALERLQSALLGIQITQTSGFIREAGDLGPILRDKTVEPNRWYVPVDLVVEL